MKRIAYGEPEAMRQMISSSMPRIWALAVRVLGDATAAEDVAQETVIRAVRKAPDWTGGAARLDTWLHTVALNLCRDRLKRRREIVTEKIPESADPAISAEAAMIEAERSRDVAAAIKALPERQREAIILVHYQELSGVAAADALGISVEALESLLARGRRSLKQRFLDEERGDG